MWRKKECVGHIQKRVGRAPRKMKKDNKGMCFFQETKLAHQNQNESLNGMIWNRLPKTIFGYSRGAQFWMMMLVILMFVRKQQ
jgi:hypothetical protein